MILDVPPAKLAVGVSVAVQTAPVPVKPDKTPFVATMSPMKNEVPMSSLKVKVMVAVCPAKIALRLEVMVKVGAVVSTRTEPTVQAG